MENVWYLSGRMTGIPQFNYPRFTEVAKELRERGYTIQTPSEGDRHDLTATIMESPDGALDSLGGDTTWADFLSEDVKTIADHCTGIILMDDWWWSRGATLECFLAMTLEYPLMKYWEGSLRPTSRRRCLELIKVGMFR